MGNGSQRLTPRSTGRAGARLVLVQFGAARRLRFARQASHGERSLNTIRLGFASRVAAALLVSACATSPSGDAALLQRDSAWAATAKARDVEAILSYWSDDAVVIAPGSPEIRGKTAIREYVQKSLALPRFSISWTPASAAISSDGKLGYTTGQNVVTVAGPDGKLLTIPGRYVTVWRRDADGAWRCVVDIWNTR